MPQLLTHYAVRALRGERIVLETPVLIWATARAERPGGLRPTAPHQHAQQPAPGEPLVMELRKGEHSGNAFSMGVTVGRAESNDVYIDDDSVSRFHAYFQQTLARGQKAWCVVDAESMNGTCLNTFRLPANKPEPLRSGDVLKFGDVEVMFLEAVGFEKYLAQQATK